MSVTHEQLVGRIAAVEFILIQTLGIVTSSAVDKETLFSVLRESFDDRFHRLPDDVRPYAADTADRIFSAALEISRRWPEQE
jgi:hypothetical protein